MAETVIWKNDKNVMPYNGDFPLCGAITYNGGDGNIHPKGKRPFNNQELAQLQGFPSTHKFVGTKTSIMKQIGNAVPSKAATPFFEEIMRSLKKFDREVAAHKDEVIEID
jgi:DNA (cytosine-5)-methyltransferase 1